MAVQKLGVLTAGRSMCSTRRSQADGALTSIKVALRPHTLFLLIISFILVLRSQRQDRHLRQLMGDMQSQRKPACCPQVPNWSGKRTNGTC